MFAFFRSLPSSLIRSSCTMSTKSSPTHANKGFASLLVHDLYTNTDAFLTIYRSGMDMSADADRISAFSRFTVETITGNKQHLKTSQHEYISAKVRDEKTGSKYTFFFERTASSQSTFHLQVRASEVPASLSPASLSSASLSPASLSPASLSLPVELVEQPSKDKKREAVPPETCDPCPSSSISLFPPRPLMKRASQHSINDMVSTTSFKALHSSAVALSLERFAEDRIFSERVFMRKAEDDCKELGQVIHEISPKKLSLFELAILADVIHEHEPNYHLFRNQCFWFTNSIVEIIVALHGDKLENALNGPTNYLPDLSGRWKNMRVYSPEEREMCAIADEYLKRRTAEFNRVKFCHICPIYLKFNYLKGV